MIENEIHELTSNLKPLGLDVCDDLDSSLGDVGHILSMAMFAKEAGCADDNVQTVHACSDSQPGIFHITSDIWQSIRHDGHKMVVVVTHGSKSWPLGTD